MFKYLLEYFVTKDKQNRSYVSEASRCQITSWR